MTSSSPRVNLEDISAPRCCEIETRLKERLDISVFHDDQHGTAVVALAALTNALRLADVMAGADVYIGVSGGQVPEEIVASMADDAIIFGLANPTPEVHPDLPHKYARVAATGRSDFPNQINNVLAFPGIIRGAFDVHATALAELVGDDLAEDLVIPSPFDPPRPRCRTGGRGRCGPRRRGRPPLIWLRARAWRPAWCRGVP